MKRKLHFLSMLAGAGCAALVFLSMAQNSTPDPTSWNYRIVEDVKSDDLKDLAAKGWEFAGYLGESEKGDRTDETLWRQMTR
jgi:hypothetical protein